MKSIFLRFFLSIFLLSLFTLNVKAQSRSATCDVTTTISTNTDGPVALFTDRECLQINSGASVSSPSDSIQNYAREVQITNSGTITGNSGLYTNPGSTLRQLTNIGSFDSNYWGIYHGGELTDLNNSGLIRGGGAGIYVDGGVIQNLNNSGTISSAGFGIQVTNFSGGSSGAINRIINTGIISGEGSAIVNESRIGELSNSGQITSEIYSAIFNYQTIDSLVNRSGGEIAGYDGGIFNVGSASLITSLNNSGRIIGNLTQGIENGGTIGALVNAAGATIAGQSGIVNRGGASVIRTLENAGTIGGFLREGIFNEGTIGTLLNQPGGRIAGIESGIVNQEGASITTLSNLGRIEGNIYFGIDNIASIQTLTNATGAEIVSEAAAVLNRDTGSIQLLNNNGLIRSGYDSPIFNNGSISALSNSGTILSTGWDGIFNGGSSNPSIGTLNNSGTIQGFYFGIVNEGVISTLTNTGSIIGETNGGIWNGLAARIGTLNNAQGSGNAAGPLTYQGPLPGNYNVIVYSPTRYGQLAVADASGTTTFGIYSGSNLAKGTYQSVLSGVTVGNLNNTSGIYNGLRWSLSNSSFDIWDLIIAGASTADTQQSLVNTASVLQGTFTLQNSVMVNGFSYDCALFDRRGICVSVGGRNTSVQAQGINNTSGLLIASYRLDQNNSRFGAWIDQNLSVSGPGTVQLNNSTPMIGLFGVWSQRPDGVGAEVKVSAAYGQKGTTITRQVVNSSEPGSGSSQLISQGAQAIAKYGFAVLPDVIVSPYAGLRYTQNNMGGYTEAMTSTVTEPLTYSALNTNATTVLAGAEARYRGIPKTTLFASAGVETDTNTNNGSYVATGVSGLTPVNFNPNPVKTRPTATLGGYYDILKNQRIGVTGIYRQEPFQAVSTTTVLLTYTIGL